MADDLIARLRGIYTVPVADGAGPLHGKDTYTRTFDVPPIQREAADEIERLRAATPAAPDGWIVAWKRPHEEWRDRHDVSPNRNEENAVRMAEEYRLQGHCARVRPFIYLPEAS